MRLVTFGGSKYVVTVEPSETSGVGFALIEQTRKDQTDPESEPTATLVDAPNVPSLIVVPLAQSAGALDPDW